MSKYTGDKNLQTNPANTDLRLIHDNRSGVRLEIVIPVFDEEKRINNIIHYYNGFDIVILDGGSTDRTIEIAIKYGATVYSRVGDSVGENHFTYYANAVSKSGYCFYMMADELINKNDLKEAAEHLRNEDSVIGVRKIEWIYCEEPMTKRSPALGMPRGFRQGTAVYDPYNIHNSLLHVANPNMGTRMFVYDLHHLHIKSIKGEYGKFGRYLDAEIRQMHERNATVPNYMRRFLIPILVAVFWRIWFNKTSIPCKLFRILELVMASQLALMCWIEKKFMPSVDEQMACYSSKYFKDV